MEQQSKPVSLSADEGKEQFINRWWSDEIKNRRNNVSRRNRALFRRCHRLTDVFRVPAFHYLDAYYRNPELAAVLALTLAHVDNEPTSEVSFFESLGKPKVDGRDSPVLSELRFQQLVATRTPEEFARCLRRAIQLLGGVVSVLSIERAILDWWQDRIVGKSRTGEDNLDFKWARAYYSHSVKVKSQQQ